MSDTYPDRSPLKSNKDFLKRLHTVFIEHRAPRNGIPADMGTFTCEYRPIDKLPGAVGCAIGCMIPLDRACQIRNLSYRRLIAKYEDIRKHFQAVDEALAANAQAYHDKGFITHRIPEERLAHWKNLCATVNLTPEEVLSAS